MASHFRCANKCCDIPVITIPKSKRICQHRNCDDCNNIKLICCLTCRRFPCKCCPVCLFYPCICCKYITSAPINCCHICGFSICKCCYVCHCFPCTCCTICHCNPCGCMKNIPCTSPYKLPCETAFNRRFGPSCKENSKSQRKRICHSPNVPCHHFY